jgi:hypothetical protein
MPVRNAITCTPAALVAASPCLHCVSKSDLLAVLALIMCKLAGASADADCTPATLQENAKCFECMSDQQMLEVLVVIFGDYAIYKGYLDAGDLRHEVECLTCVKPKMLRAIILERLCHFVHDQEDAQ